MQARITRGDRDVELLEESLACFGSTYLAQLSPKLLL